MNERPRNEVPPTIHIGLLGYAFMGKSHSNGIRQINYMLADPPARAELTALCGRDEAALKAAARQFGARHTYTDWREMIASGEIQLFDNGGPNDIHAEPCIAAAAAGIHLLCEKPLARNAPESLAMLEAARAAGVKHMTAYNYRFVPRHPPAAPPHRFRCPRPHLPLPRRLPAGLAAAPYGHAPPLAHGRHPRRQRRPRRPRRPRPRSRPLLSR